MTRAANHSNARLLPAPLSQPLAGRLLLFRQPCYFHLLREMGCIAVTQKLAGPAARVIWFELRADDPGTCNDVIGEEVLHSPPTSGLGCNAAAVTCCSCACP